MGASLFTKFAQTASAKRALGYRFEAGFAAADEIVEMSFKTAPVHQAYIEPQGCVLAR